jgi:hypothetical protein
MDAAIRGPLEPARPSAPALRRRPVLSTSAPGCALSAPGPSPMCLIRDARQRTGLTRCIRPRTCATDSRPRSSRTAHRAAPIGVRRRPRAKSDVLPASEERLVRSGQHMAQGWCRGGHALEPSGSHPERRLRARAGARVSGATSGPVGALTARWARSRRPSPGARAGSPRLGDETYDAHVARGAAMSYDEIVAHSLDELDCLLEQVDA